MDCVWLKIDQADTYSGPNPFTCNILICLTIVDFPDSPAPKNAIYIF